MLVREIVHADMDAFYASIEQRDNPSLRGRPVIVGATTPRGVVAAASYEARKFGIFSAMPGFEAHRLCPDAVFVAGRHKHYAAVSAQLQEIFRSFTPLVEPLALDEAFLDVTGCGHLFGGLESLAQTLQRKVWERTQLRVSVGIAPNKLVAKIACAQGKPRGLIHVEPEEVEAFLAPLPIGKLWGVGPVLEKRLRILGINTLGELSAYKPALLIRLIGARGSELQQLARGQDERPVVANRVAKSYGEENTFERDISSSERILEVLAVQADSVARRLRKAGVRGRTITIKVRPASGARRQYSGARGAQHLTHTRSKSIAQPVDDSETIIQVARGLWLALGTKEPIRLLGLSVSGLETAAQSGGQQLDLFAEPGASATGKRVPIGAIVDQIEERFGAGAIRRAVTESPTRSTPEPMPRGEPKE